MDKETLLARFVAHSEAFTQALDGIPHEAFETPGVVNGRSLKEVCALLTAWDGEALRRVDFVTGRRLEPPHNPHDTIYWETWLRRQIEVKCIMSTSGVLVDMIGTRQRLLARLAELSDFQIERWLAQDPQAMQPHFAEYLREVQAWRASWDAAHPPPRGLKKLWQGLRRRLGERK